MRVTALPVEGSQYSESMRSVLAHGGYVPYRRLDRAEIAEVMGSGGGRGSRSVASYDEDTTTMGVEAARIARRAPAAREPEAIWFATAEPAYLEKTNATAVHAALRVGSQALAFDAGGAVRSGVAALRAALEGRGTSLVVASGLRTGLPTGPDEAAGGDGAAAVLVGEGPGVADYLGGASATSEFVDRWRLPGDPVARQWEERFAETRYLPLAEQAWTDALKAAELSGTVDVDRVVATGPHARSVRRFATSLGDIELVDDLAATVGHTGAAHPALVLSHALDTAAAGQVIAVVSLADGADVLVFRVTEAAATDRPIARQIESTAPVGYARFLQWRGMLSPQPPNRPEPARPSASAAARRTDWKFGFVGSRGDVSGAVHLPPARVSIDPSDAVDGGEPVPMADAVGTVATFTVDRLSYSPSPPTVFAVVDFDGGGRLPVELTDVDPDEVGIGDRVEMTFRRLFTADGLHNYFWKARPLPAAGDQGG